MMCIMGKILKIDLQFTMHPEFAVRKLFEDFIILILCVIWESSK